jgi:hypothetical protein
LTRAFAVEAGACNPTGTTTNRRQQTPEFTVKPHTPVARGADATGASNLAAIQYYYPLLTSNSKSLVHKNP